MATHQIELSAGTIDYEDTGGVGPTVVLLHGLLMDASLWDRLLEIDDRYTLIPLDQPARLTQSIRDFVPATTTRGYGVISSTTSRL
jgi:pimeloyl-ACP methyl ester carboxylesterase